MSRNRCDSSGTCACGAWTGSGHVETCDDCKRKNKTLVRVCSVEGCGDAFRAKSGSGYTTCLKHRGLRKDAKTPL